VIGLEPDRLEHMQRIGGARCRDRHRGEVGHRHGDAAGDAEHRVHEPLARARLIRDLLGGESDESGDGRTHACALLDEQRRQRAEPRAPEQARLGGLLVAHRASDRSHPPEVEVARLIGEGGDPLVEAGGRGIHGLCWGHCPNLRCRLE
jgi:hypothetical protein